MAVLYLLLSMSFGTLLLVDWYLADRIDSLLAIFKRIKNEREKDNVIYKLERRLDYLEQRDTDNESKS